jgi:hypothetical protein
MSLENEYVHDNSHKRPKSVYQQLSGILNALKTEEITLNEAMSKIQLKDNKTKVDRPYCKVNNGLMELYGITNKPITMNSEQWKKFLKLAKSNYIDNYMKYNETRLSSVTNSSPKNKKKFTKKDNGANEITKENKEKDFEDDFEQVNAESNF